MPGGGPLRVQQSRPAQGQELEDLERLAAEYRQPEVPELLAEQLRQAQEQKQQEYRPPAQDEAALLDAATKALSGTPLVKTIKDFLKLVATRGRISPNFITEIQKYTNAIKEAADEHYRTNRMLPNGGQFSLKLGQLTGSKPKRTLIIVAYLLRLMTLVKDSIFPAALKEAVRTEVARFSNMFNLEARDLIGAMETLIDAQNQTQEIRDAIRRLNT